MLMIAKHRHRSATVTVAAIAVAGVVAAASAVGPAAFASAQPPVLDSTFSGDGVVSSDFGGSDTLQGVAVAPDGGVVVAGTFTESGHEHATVARYLSDGQPDTTFGVTGRADLAWPDATLSGNVVVQPDAKIVAVGYVGRRLLVVRLDSDGSLDPTFSGNGWIRGPIDRSVDASTYPPLVALDSAGNVVVAANRDLGRNRDETSVLRYTPSGRLDTSFSDDGVQPVVEPGQDSAQGLTVDTADRVLVVLAGALRRSPRIPASVVRLTAQGEFDPTFSGDGVRQLRLDATGSGTFPVSVDVTDAGAVVVGLRAVTSSRIGVVQLLADGAPDPTYGTSGKAVQECSVACRLAGRWTPSGYVFYGATQNSRGSDASTYVARLRPNGSGFDAGFGVDGEWIDSVFPGWEAPGHFAAVDSAGRILLAGAHRSSSTRDGFVVRLDLAAPVQTVALWNMNELPGAGVLVDSGPNRLNGTIGTSITLNGDFQTFPRVTRGTGGTIDPEHLDVIDSPLLNPGTGDFIVTVRLRIASVVQSLGNVMQKGQTGTPGGFWKIQLDGGNGRVLCEFVSPTGSGGIRSAQVVADNQWHTVTCERTPTAVMTTVDGVTTRLAHAVGNIVNDQPLSIGGKHKCTATPHHDCDYFIGSIDYVEIRTGG